MAVFLLLVIFSKTDNKHIFYYAASALQRIKFFVYFTSGSVNFYVKPILTLA